MNDQAKIAEKIAEYKKILVQDNKSLVFVPLAICYLKSNQPDDALETALKGTWELPTYAPGYVAVAHVYAHRKVYPKSISAFKKAMEVDPSCLDAFKGLARTYRDQGEIEAAIKLLTRAVNQFPDEPSLKQMLESLSSVPAAGSTNNTSEQVQKNLKPITTATIAEIYIKQQLFDKALEVYRELYAETNDPAVMQKIAEIEAMNQGVSHQQVSEVTPPDVVATPTTGSVAATDEPMRISGQSVLDNLNSMLAAIQARRNRV